MKTATFMLRILRETFYIAIIRRRFPILVSFPVYRWFPIRMYIYRENATFALLILRPTVGCVLWR